MAHPGPRISVIIPCYDDGPFLLEALASVRRQEPCEVVVVDDGSTDSGTVALLAQLAQDGVRVVHQPNAGVSAARMAGVVATAAPYVFPLDADDQVAAGSLSMLADALDANPSAVAAWGDVEIIGIGPGRTRRRAPDTVDPWLLTYVNDLSASALLRREALLAAGGWQLVRAHEDWDLWMAIAERGWTGVRVDRVVEIHRRHPGRRWARVTAEQDQDALLRERHPFLFAQRRRNWIRSRAPWHSRIGLPLVARLGFLPDRDRQRLSQLVHHPTRLLGERLLRLRQGLDG